MKTMVVYESMFGNTRDVAEAIADGLRVVSEIEMYEVGEAPDMIGQDVDLLIVGGPTHQFGMTRSSSRESAASQSDEPLVSSGRGVREWLSTVDPGRPGLPAAAFDTTMKSPRFLKYLGSAAGSIMKQLRARGCEPAARPERFWVDGGQGPLTDGEMDRARQWSADVASRVQTAQRATGIA